MPNSILHSSFPTHKNTNSTDESLGFLGDTAVKTLCITAYPGILAADLASRFPKITTGFITLNLFNSINATNLTKNKGNTPSLSHQPINTINSKINECNQYKPKTKDVYAIRAHSQCLLSLTEQHYPNHHVPYQLTPKVYHNLRQMSFALPAAHVMEELNKNPIKNQEEHTHELLRFILGIPSHENSHQDLRHLCGLEDMFSLSQQAQDILLLFSEDIKSLIKDKTLTEPMVKVFQTEFLEHYRNKLPANISDGIKLGFESFWKGGPAESALLLKALEDIEQGKQAISWSPQTLHILSLLSHAWETTLSVVLPEKTALDSIVHLGKAIMRSRATFCDYVRTAASVGMALSAHPELTKKGEHIGRIHSTHQIHRNALHLNDLLHKHPSFRAVPRSELITTDLEASLTHSLKKTEAALEFESFNHNKIKVRCKRAGEGCFPFNRINHNRTSKNRSSHREATSDATHLYNAEISLNALNADPIHFLQENSLVTGYFEQGKSAYLNKISNGKYQISTTPLSDAIDVPVHYLDVIREDTINLKQIPDINLNQINSNIIATPLLTGCTITLKIKNGEPYLAHIQPVAKEGVTYDSHRHLNLQKELRKNSYMTYGPENYHGKPARFIGIKEDGNWHFYSQQLRRGNLIAKEIFKRHR